MAEYLEVQEWRDIPHKDKKEEIVIRFLITYVDETARTVLNVGAEIFRAARPDEKYILQGLRYGHETPFSTVFSGDRSIHGWLCWRTGLDVKNPQQIMGRVELDESWEISYWNYVGYMIGFGGITPTPPGPEPDPIGPDLPVPGPLPLPEPSDGMAIAQAHLDAAELFPFVYLKPWPKLPKSRAETRFMTVPNAVKSSDFFSALKSANAAARQQDAVDFIDDTINPTSSPTYPDQFVTETTVLPSPYLQYQAFPSELRRDCTYDALDTWVTDTFGSWDDLADALAKADAQTALTNIWNSCIALMITLGYDQGWFAELIQLLQVVHLNDYVLAFQTAHPAREGQDAPTPDDRDLQRAIGSVMVLPDDIFPITPPPDPADPPAIQLYAVGAVRTVHYQPGRYVLGDVQRIETVQPGETRQEARRNLTRTEVKTESAEVSDNSSTDRQDTSTADLINQVQKTLLDRVSTTNVDNYHTDYGNTANTMTVTGNWWVQDQPAGGYLKDISRFARDVIDRSVRALRQENLKRRTNWQFSETEHLETRTLSNPDGTMHQQSVYRWVNRQYALETHSGPDRMVYELFLDNPGAYLVDAIRHYRDLQLAPPQSPAQLGIKSYTDLTPEPVQSGSGVYYLTAYQEYGIAPDGSPPLAKRVISSGVKSRNPVAETSLTVPSGYTPGKVTAAVTGLSSDASSTSVVIGGTALTAGTATGKTIPFTGDLSSDDALHNSTALWCSVFSPPPAPPAQTGDADNGSGPAPDASPDEGADEFTTYFAANIQVECARNASTLAAWQIETYQKIQAAYEAAEKAYQDILTDRQHSLNADNPEFLTQLVQDQIIQAAIALFAKATLAPGDDQASRLTARNFEPRYAQFLRNAFDWGGMSVDLIQDPDADPYLNEDQSDLIRLFSPSRYIRDFVHAKQVRLMLSVKPNAARMLLLAFRTGMIWPCAEHLAPCLEQDRSVLDQLLEESRDTAPVQFDSWTITVPTTMVALSDLNL